MDGDGIGGSINLVTKTAGDRPTLSVSGMGGYTPIDAGRDLTELTGTVGKRFGAQKRLGLLIGGTYDWNGRGIDDIEPVADVQHAVRLHDTFESIDVRQYVYYRSRWGLTGSADYKLGQASNIYVRGLYSDFKNYGDRTDYTLNNNGIPCSSTLRLGSGGGRRGTLLSTTQDRRPDISIGSLAIGGNHVLTSTWYSWEAAVSRSADYNRAPGQANFASTLSTSACQYDPATTTNLYLPQWTPSCYTEAYNLGNYTLDSIQTDFGHTAQLNLQAEASMGKRYNLGSHPATFELGGKFRNAHKFDDTYSTLLSPNTAIPLSQFPSRTTNNNYYNGAYPAGPNPHYQDVIAFANANSGDFTSSSSQGIDPANYDLVEKVSAGYLMNTIDLTSRLRFIAGIRFEGTNLTTTSFDTQSNTLSDRANGSYVSILPSASIRYGLTPRYGSSPGLRARDFSSRSAGYRPVRDLHHHRQPWFVEKYRFAGQSQPEGGNRGQRRRAFRALPQYPLAWFRPGISTRTSDPIVTRNVHRE